METLKRFGMIVAIRNGSETVVFLETMVGQDVTFSTHVQHLEPMLGQGKVIINTNPEK